MFDPLGEVLTSDHYFDEVGQEYWLRVNCDSRLRLLRQSLGFFAFGAIVAIRVNHDGSLLCFCLTLPQTFASVILVGTFFAAAVIATAFAQVRLESQPLAMRLLLLLLLTVF